MRRKEREVTALEEKLELLNRQKVMRLAMADGAQPYLVPLNFGYEMEGESLLLYFHCAREGRKMELLLKNPRVCFEVDGAHSLLEGETPCEYSFAYESLIGEGVAEFLEADADKVRGLEAIMRHQADHKVAPEYPPAALRAVAVGRIAVSNWTGKRHLPR